MDCFTSNKFNI